MTTQPMPLEETAKLLREFTDHQESLQQFYTEPLPGIPVLRAALHHLEAGKRDAERLDRLQSHRWVDIRNNHDGLATSSAVDLPGPVTGYGSTLREAIDNLSNTPTEEPQG